MDDTLLILTDPLRDSLRNKVIKVVYSKELDYFLERFNKEFNNVEFKVLEKVENKKTKIIGNCHSIGFNYQPFYSRVIYDVVSTFKKYKKYLKKLDQEHAYNKAVKSKVISNIKFVAL